MWYAKNTGGYNIGTTEATANGTEIYGILNSLGYAIISIAAILGNIDGESDYNPWQWQDNNIQSTTSYRSNTGVGYGLVQWTPSTEYIDSSIARNYAYYNPHFSDRNGAATDGDAQTRFIDYQLFNGGNYFWNQSRRDYYHDWFLNVGKDTDDFTSMTATEFKNGVLYNGVYNWTIEDFVGAFELKYLRPRMIEASARYWTTVNQAQWWYDYLSGITPPTPPDPPVPPPTQREHMPVWMMIKYY